MINTEEASNVLARISGLNRETAELNCVSSALDDVQDRTWDIPVMQVHQKIEEIIHEQK